MYRDNNTMEVYETVEEAVEEALEEGRMNGILDEYYDEWLDEMGDVEIGSLSYSPSLVLQKVDPIAYSLGYDDFTSWLYDDFVYDLNHGRDIDCYGIEIEEIEDEEEGA